MSRKSNQKLKLYRLCRIMLRETDESHGLTIAQIKDRLSEYDIPADRKSLYNDLEALGDLGVWIDKRQEGRNYYYYVSEKLFELPELKLLADSVGASKFITKKKSEALIKKLMGFASRYEESQLNRQVYVSGRIKTMNESIYYNVDAIYAAIANNRQISFEYLIWGTDKKLHSKRESGYVVSPWELLWSDENYYLIAYDSGADMIKHYRVDKMRRIKATDDIRDGQQLFEQFDAGAYTNKSFGMFGGDEKSVRIRFDNSMIGVMIDRFGKDINVYSVDSEHSDIIVRVAVSDQFFGWIFALGTRVKIVSPDSVAADFRRALKAMESHYNIC